MNRTPKFLHLSTMSVWPEREQHKDQVVLQILQALCAGLRGLVCQGGPKLGLDAGTQTRVLLVHRVHRGVDQAENCAQLVLF